MAGLFGLSVDPQVYQDAFLEDLLHGAFYQQHSGEEYAGFASCNEGTIKIRTHRGLIRPTFGRDMPGLEGQEAIGFCGAGRELVHTDSRLGEFAACLSGNITNSSELIHRFKNFGHSFAWGGEDIELVVKLIAQKEDMIEGIKWMAGEVHGAYSLLIVSPKGIYAVCSPDGHWPMVIGAKEGATAVAPESHGFTNSGFKIVHDLEPGEVVLLKDGRWETKVRIPSTRIQVCSFLWVYTAFPAARIGGIPASLVRKRLGAALARRDIADRFTPDIVAPVPDSGRFHAIGYMQEFCRQINQGLISKIPLYDEALLKYPYAGRSFIPREWARRALEAHIKLLRSGEDYQNLIVVVVDDSVVRGTQMQTNLVPKLKELGIKEIHARIANPALLSHCPWGKTTRAGEVLASRLPSIRGRAEFLGVDSLEHNEIGDLVEAIGFPLNQLCVDCALPGSV